MRPPREWTRGTRKPGAGMHIYIPKEEVERSLRGAGLDPTEVRLLVRSVSMITKRKGLAKIVIEVKPDWQRICPPDFSFDRPQVHPNCRSTILPTAPDESTGKDETPPFPGSGDAPVGSVSQQTDMEEKET